MRLKATRKWLPNGIFQMRDYTDADYLCSVDCSTTGFLYIVSHVVTIQSILNI